MQRPGNAEPSFTLGLEEEYLLVDLATRDLVSDPPPELLQRCIAETDGRVSPEFLRSQLEVKTSVCGSVSAMRRELGSLRRKVCEISAISRERPFSLSIVTPKANWTVVQPLQRNLFNSKSMCSSSHIFRGSAQSRRQRSRF